MFVPKISAVVASPGSPVSLPLSSTDREGGAVFTSLQGSISSSTQIDLTFAGPGFSSSVSYFGPGDRLFGIPSEATSVTLSVGALSVGRVI